MELSKKKIKKLLLTERAETEIAIATTIKKSMAELRSNGATKAKNCLKDCHPTMMVVHSGKVAQLRKYLRKIAKAFEKLRNGTYGVCRDCGDPIPTARLRVCPATDICLPCKTTLEVAAQTARKNFHHCEARAAA